MSIAAMLLICPAAMGNGDPPYLHRLASHGARSQDSPIDFNAHFGDSETAAYTSNIGAVPYPGASIPRQFSTSYHSTLNVKAL